jgi:aryl-alcohol dehydrogenase-like predicted oxidoreductase
MSPRPLGHSGLTVSRLGLGCTTFGRESTEAEAFALMDYALANGITLFDTAEAYGGGQARAYRRAKLGVDDSREVSGEMHSSEKIIGRWFRARGTRDRITLVTKVTRDFRTSKVREALEASLARLQTDHADLYLYHSFDPASPPDEAALAMDAVIRAGLTRAGGCSNHSGPQLQAALETSRSRGLHAFSTIQLPHNLLQNTHDALSVAEEHGLGVMAYSPLAAGFLSGKYTADRNSVPKGSRFDVIPAHADIYFNERNFQRVGQLHRFAQKVGVPALQLAIAWVLQNPLIDTVLIGARTQAQLDNAIAAHSLGFAPEWLAEIGTWA